MSHQSDHQLLRYSYFEIWPWNIQGQSHEWGQRSRSHNIPSIQPMHFLFVSHQSEQPFLRCGQNSVWPWKNTSEFLKRKLAKITVFNITFPKSHQVMTRVIKLPRFVVIGWVIRADKLCQIHGAVTQYILPDLYILCPKYLRCSVNGFDVRSKGHCGGVRGGGERGRNELKT